MKVSVLGAGAVGSIFGGLIRHHRPDVDVTLVVRGEHGRAISESGELTLVGPWGRRRVPIGSTFEVGDIRGSDVVLVTVKSHATVEALEAARQHLGDATVVSIQNGINDATLRRYVAPERLVCGMTATNMAVLEPGTVSLQLDGSTVVGPFPDGVNAEAARAAAKLLTTSGLRVVHHRNAIGVRYNKLAINAIGYASCLSRSNFITEAVCDREWREHVGRPMLAECAAAFRAAGVKPARIPRGTSFAGLRRLMRLLDVPGLGAGISWIARGRYNRQPILFSLGQDLLKGRPTEIDHVNGEIVRLAREFGVDAPCNARIVELCHVLERRGPGAFASREEVVDHVRGQSINSPRRPLERIRDEVR